MKKFIRYFGYLIVGFSLYYLGKNVLDQADKFDSTIFTNFNLIFTVFFGLIYGLALLFMSLAWAAMVSESGIWNLSAIAAYTKSSILKYLPGNIMHFVGRNLANHSSGLDHWRMSSATLAEITFSILSAILISSFIFLFVESPISRNLMAFTTAFAIFGVILVPFVPRAIAALSHRWPNIFKLKRMPQNLFLGFVLILIGFFLVTVIAIFIGRLLILGSYDPLYTGGLYILAWLVGFVVPGAPGGLGVREAFLVAGLSLASDTSIALAFALVMRVVSTIGDILIFFVGVHISNRLED